MLELSDGCFNITMIIHLKISHTGLTMYTNRTSQQKIKISQIKNLEIKDNTKGEESQ
jgi:hypothetical protein